MYDESRPIQLGIVGCGGRGVGLGREMAAIGLGRVVAICDPNEQRIRIAQGRFGEARVAKDACELAGWDDVEAIIVATPDDTHVEIALALKPFGKHLLVEKPLAVSLADCDRLVCGFAEQTDMVQMVGLCMRYNNMMQRVHELVAGGAIGEVLTAHCIDNVSVGGNYYFHRWMSRKKHVVGLLVQKGVHSLDFISWVIGSRPVRVHAFGGLDYYGGEEATDKVCSACDEFDDCTERMDRVVEYDYIKEKVRASDLCAYSREVDVCDNSVVNVLYESGAKVSYSEVHFTPDYVREFSFIGTKGRIYACCPHGKTPELTLTLRHRPTKAIRETVEMGEGGHAGGDRAMLREFVDAINEKRKPLTDFVEGRECAAISLAAEESIERGEVVDVRNVDGSKRSVTHRKGRSRELSRKDLLNQAPRHLF